jgi:hypothetical protein
MCPRYVDLLYFQITLYFLGQSTLVPNYSCDQDNDTVGFTLSPSPHSGWEPTSNCLLQQCVLSSNNNDSCRSSSTPCFDYRTINNTCFCAPGILCAILEPCNSTTYTCESDALVCVVNSCCSPPAICIPSSWTDFCILGNDAFYIERRDSILLASSMNFFVFTNIQKKNNVFFCSLFVCLHKNSNQFL